MEKKTRSEFLDSHDTQKWTEVAVDQETKYPTEGYDMSSYPFYTHLRERELSVGVDLGCSTGLCRSMFPDVYIGVDQNPEAVAAAQRRHP